MKEEAQLWLGYAQRDLLAANVLLNNPDPITDIAAFHIQQFAEKTIKAVLTAEGVRPRRTHDIGYLLTLIPRNHRLYGDLAALEPLTKWSTEFRYPGDDVGLGGEIAPRASDVKAALGNAIAAYEATKRFIEQG